MEKKDYVTQNRFNERVEEVDKQFDAVDKRFDKLEAKMDKGFAEVDKRFNKVDKRFNEVMNIMDKRFNEVIDAIGHYSSRLEIKVDRDVYASRTHARDLVREHEKAMH